MDEKFVAVPLPRTLADALRLSDQNLLRLLKVLLVQVDEKLRSFASNKAAVDAIVSTLHEETALEARVDAAEAFARPYTIVSHERVFQGTGDVHIATKTRTAASEEEEDEEEDSVVAGRMWRVPRPLLELRMLIAALQTVTNTVRAPINKLQHPWRAKELCGFSGIG